MTIPTRESRTKPLSKAVNEQVVLAAGNTAITYILRNIYVPMVQVGGWFESLKSARLIGGFNRAFSEEIGLRFELGTSDYNTANNRVKTGENGFLVDDPVRFEEHDVLPAPFAAATTYFVLAKPSDTRITLSATVQGAELDITSKGTGVNVLRFALNAELNSLETAMEAVIDEVISIVPVTPTTLELRARTFNKALTNSTDGMADIDLTPAQTASLRTALLDLQNEIEAPV